MRDIKISRSSVLIILYTALVIAGVARVYFYEDKAVSALPVNKRVIVVDAGHGGWDPGKVASDGIREKELNLKIAELVSGYLRQAGAEVYSTRAEDEALSQNKRQDLKLRADMADVSGAELFVSIHQNSFPKSSVKGAQVFYHKKSEEGKRLATFIQKRLKAVVDVDNSRVPKANTSYYLLKEVKVPSVIVECGFLSNADEHDKLSDSDYQNKIAWAIYMGITDYFTEEEGKSEV